MKRLASEANPQREETLRSQLKAARQQVRTASNAQDRAKAEAEAKDILEQMRYVTK